MKLSWMLQANSQTTSKHSGFHVAKYKWRFRCSQVPIRFEQGNKTNQKLARLYSNCAMTITSGAQ